VRRVEIEVGIQHQRRAGIIFPVLQVQQIKTPSLESLRSPATTIVFVEQRLAKIFHRTAQRIELKLIGKTRHFRRKGFWRFCASQALSTITADISNNRFSHADFLHIAIILANTIVYTSSAMLKSG
jgi:hypothetical protein